MNVGDVLLLIDGRMARVIDKDILFYTNLLDSSIRVQFSDRTEETLIKRDPFLEVERNLGNSPEVVGNFYNTWGLHKRLNLMGL